MDIKPGFYIAHFKNKPDSVLIAKVYGKQGFYRIDAWKDVIASSGVIISNLDMEKTPLVFIKRLTEFDKEG
ncbi:hypothetical protein KAR10_03075 [bacterium]|nr:hypothetical protein [bacterium]